MLGLYGISFEQYALNFGWAAMGGATSYKEGFKKLVSCYYRYKQNEDNMFLTSFIMYRKQFGYE